MARLSTPDGSTGLEVGAMGDTLSWQPYHAKDDLLWVDSIGLPAVILTPPKVLVKRTGDKAARTANGTKDGKGTGTAKEATLAQKEGIVKTRAFTGSYKFGVAKMFALMDRIASARCLTIQEGMDVTDINRPSALEEYRAFLISGGFIEPQEALVATDALDDAVRALKGRDLDRAVDLFARVPTFAAFLGFLKGEISENPVAERA
jgi:hypothetical protein